MDKGVAPLVGAWIEINLNTSYETWSTTSLPSWERGLKYSASKDFSLLPWSLPSWERGLKLY